MKDILQFIADILAAIAWPVVIVLIIKTLKAPIGEFLARSKSVRIKVPGGTRIDMSADEAKEIVQDVLDGIDELVEDVDDAEKAILTNLSKQSPQPLSAIYPNFKRGESGSTSPEHETLRKLRRRHLIRPVEGSKWKVYKNVELTPFGSLVLKLKEKELIN